MIIHRDTLKVALLATTADASRYYLDAVQVHPDGRVVSTNGHMLLVVRDTNAQPDGDFPQPPHTVPFATTPDVAVCIPAPLALKLIAATAKKSTIPILACVQVGLNADGAPFATATDLDTALSSPLPHGPDAPRFPKFEHVLVPADRPHLSVTFSGTYLVALAKAAALINKDALGGTVEFQIPTETKYQQTRTVTPEQGDPFTEPTGQINAQVRIVIAGPERTLEGVLMPVRR